MEEQFCEKYFEGKVKPIHLQKFEAKTPKGNMIGGYICRKANRYLGSMVITHIKEKGGRSYDTEQFVQSFPKIHYWDDRHKLKEDDESIIYYCQEKLDGTCIIFYSLNNDLGESIEIIPKTRGQPVADEHILSMIRLIDKKAIKNFFEDDSHNNDTLMFELYGILNRHKIAHTDTYIDIRLIGACIDGNFLNYISLKCYSDLDNFMMPDTVYTIEKYPYENSFMVEWCGTNHKLANYRVTCEGSFPTLYDAISEVRVMLKKINDGYHEENGRRVIEGVVINGEHFKGGQMYLKIKSEDIEAESRGFDTVPRRFILKEVQKYFDEYGSQVEEIYQRDETHYMKYVRFQLEEEFSYEQIHDPRTIRRIKNTFMDVWDSRIPQKSLQNICEELIRDNPEANILELMKKFAKTYPSKKRQSRDVFNILSKVMERGGH
jgi:hypothetical protein